MCFHISDGRHDSIADAFYHLDSRVAVNRVSLTAAAMSKHLESLRIALHNQSTELRMTTGCKGAYLASAGLRCLHYGEDPAGLWQEIVLSITERPNSWSSSAAVPLIKPCYASSMLLSIDSIFLNTLYCWCCWEVLSVAFVRGTRKVSYLSFRTFSKRSGQRIGSHCSFPLTYR